MTSDDLPKLVGHKEKSHGWEGQTLNICHKKNEMKSGLDPFRSLNIIDSSNQTMREVT